MTDIEDQIDLFVDQRPLTALTIAIIAGALIGRYVLSSHKEVSDEASIEHHAPVGGSWRDALYRRIT